MATVLKNSAFKVKAGVVQSRSGLVPEAGAILFEKASNTFLAGDGFTWTEVGAAAVAKAKLATTLETPVVNPIIASTEDQAPLYDTVIYNLEGGFTPAGGNQITMNKTMNVDFTAIFGVTANVPNVGFDLITKLDGVEASRLSYETGQAGVTLDITALGAIPVTAANVLTLWIYADRTCDFTTVYAEMGLAEA